MLRRRFSSEDGSGRFQQLDGDAVVCESPDHAANQLTNKRRMVEERLTSCTFPARSRIADSERRVCERRRGENQRSRRDRQRRRQRLLLNGCRFGGDRRTGRRTLLDVVECRLERLDLGFKFLDVPASRGVASGRGRGRRRRQDLLDRDLGIGIKAILRIILAGRAGLLAIALKRSEGG